MACCSHWAHRCRPHQSAPASVVRDIHALATHGAFRIDPAAGINERDMFGLAPFPMIAGLSSPAPSADPSRGPPPDAVSCLDPLQLRARSPSLVTTANGARQGSEPPPILRRLLRQTSPTSQPGRASSASPSSSTCSHAAEQALYARQPWHHGGPGPPQRPRLAVRHGSTSTPLFRSSFNGAVAKVS